MNTGEKRLGTLPLNLANILLAHIYRYWLHEYCYVVLDLCIQGQNTY